MTTGRDMVGRGVLPEATMVQVPAQHRDESEDSTRLPEQISSERQMWPPNVEQSIATCASGVWTGWVSPGVGPVGGGGI